MADNRNTMDQIQAVEAVMLEKYKTEPFHNLYLLAGEDPLTSEYGGTCSDKTLSLIETLRRSGYSAALHSGYIGGEEIHRLAKVSIRNRHFFADAGNGWPAVKLYPLDVETEFTSFGMRFRTELRGRRMTIFHRRNGAESKQAEIDFDGRNESDIKADIERRFDTDIRYPFSNSVRFSLIVGKRFLFLRGERLEIYSENDLEVIEGIKWSRVPEVLRTYFGFDVHSIISKSLF